MSEETVKISRRDFLEVAGLAAGAVALPGTGKAAVLAAKRKHPDVIIFMPDQWSPRFLGFEGSQVSTPNIDLLAQEGTVFDSCYTPCPVCMPARVCLTSGQYPHNLKIWGNGPYNQDPEDCRLFRDMKAAGYYTSQVGKVHRYSGPSWKKWATSMKQLFEDSGIDHMDKLVTPFTIQHASGEYKERLVALGLFDAYAADSRERIIKNQYLVRPAVVAPEDHPDAYTADRALDLIQRHPADKPLFLFVTFSGPHTPLDASGKYETMYPPSTLKLLPNVRPFQRDGTDYGPAEVQEMYASYFGKMTMIDDQIGRIFDALKQRGTWDDTLIAFTSDHGDMLGSQGRVSKGVFYEESARVPMIVRWPGHVPAGHRSDALVQLFDVYPTAVEAAGGKLSDNHYAQSLIPLAAGTSATARDAVFSEIASKGHKNFMCRMGDYKWFVLQGTEYFFNVKADPYEMNNLINDPGSAGILAEVKDRHVKYLRETHVDYTAGNPPLVERIRSGETY